MSQPVVELDDLSVSLGGRPVLSGLRASLTGRAVGLLGPNGAGKTTLISTLLGFLPPSSGSARVLGHDVRTGAREIRALVGFMPENDSFIPGISAVRYVRMMAELSGLPRDEALERTHEALYWVGLGEARYRMLETYSLGMKQLAKLAQAIVHGPRLLFLDEPTNGLDPRTRARMIRLVREIRDSGRAHVILSSHILQDVEECCEEVLVLKEGRIAVLCDLEAERRADRTFLEMEARGGDTDAFLRALTSLGCEVAPAGKGRVKMVLGGGVVVSDLYRLALERQVQIRRMSHRRDSLQDIFLRAMESPHGHP